jgi:Spy/CpxP family protein refolding chaperone
MLADDLQLTEEQRTALDAIVAARRRAFAARRDEMRQRLEQDADSLASDVRKILTPAQQQKFDEIVTRIRSRFLNRDASARRSPD